jgi:eukaryotic-like serine/threonine-protein kinase
MDASARLSSALADRYRIERELGAGGMATVYLAHDLKHDRKVALKVLRPELAAVIGAERFLSEIKTTANLQHPHILPLFDSGAADGFLFYVMPFIEGETVRSRLTREKQLPIPDALRIASEVAAALDYAHRHGVIHRDIKPENILLHDGSALVADFGIALAASKAGGARMTETGMSLGTPHYMSPEQAMGEREITARSDVYALGAVTYEMLLGEPPFTGPTAQSIVAKVMAEKPARLTPRRERISAAVEDAVLTALEKLPADRFATAAQFAEALHRPVTAPIPSHAGPAAARSWIGDRRSQGSLALLAAAIALAVWLGSRDRAGHALDTAAFHQRSYAQLAIFKARFAPDGETIIYSAALEGNAPRLYVLRPDGMVPTQLGQDRIHLLAVSSKGELAVLVGARYIAHQLFSGTLARMPIGGGAPRELMTGVREADWSPDGSELAIIHEMGGKDRLEYPAGKVLYESPGYLSDLRVSPDGGTIALFEHPIRWDDRGAVIQVNRQGRRTLLADGYDALEGLAWSADGASVLYSGALSGEYRQVRSAAPSQPPHLLLPSPGILTIHDVTRSGRWLATHDVEQDRMFARGPADSTDRDITWLERSQSPFISADGRMVAFTDASLEAGNNYAAATRGTDGSPAVRLGKGSITDLSPDGRWVLSVILEPPQLMLYPIGAGQTRRLDQGEFTNLSEARFFAGGARYLVCGSQASRAPRCYERSLDGGPLRPLTPEGTDRGIVSPDGNAVAARRIGAGFEVFPMDSGPARPSPGLTVDDYVVGWSGDSKALLVQRLSDIPMRVERVDLSTGRRSPVLTAAPADRAGLLQIGRISLAPSGRAYTYKTRVYISQLFTVEGMR